jgi:hypothetical protein
LLPTKGKTDNGKHGPQVIEIDSDSDDDDLIFVDSRSKSHTVDDDLIIVGARAKPALSFTRPTTVWAVDPDESTLMVIEGHLKISSREVALSSNTSTPVSLIKAGPTLVRSVSSARSHFSTQGILDSSQHDTAKL